MIGHILMCDRCNGSVERGARPSTTGAATRLASNRGTIRRVLLGVRVVPHKPDRIDEARGIRNTDIRYPVRFDLCGTCRIPSSLLEYRTLEGERAERMGYAWEPATDTGEPKRRSRR